MQVIFWSLLMVILLNNTVKTNWWKSDKLVKAAAVFWKAITLFVNISSR